MLLMHAVLLISLLLLQHDARLLISHPLWLISHDPLLRMQWIVLLSRLRKHDYPWPLLSRFRLHDP